MGLTIEQALLNIEGALRQTTATYDVHMALQASLTLVKQKLTEKTRQRDAEEVIK